MSDIQGEKPVSLKTRLVIGGITAAVLAAVTVGVGTAAHSAQVQADADKAMTAAAPAYQGAITLGGNLDDLTVKSVQAKEAYDAEQARLAAEKAAAEAAAQAAAAAAAQAAAQAAADEAARQAEAQESADDSPSSDSGSSGPADTGSSKLPAGAPVPWIANPDPQDTAGGRWDTSACASGSASGNPATCD